MRCPLESADTADILIDYCGGKLSPERRNYPEQHTRACAACALFVSGQQQTWDALGEWESAAISTGFDERLHARIAEEEERESSWMSWFRWRRAMSFSAAAAAVVGFVLFNVEVATQPTIQDAIVHESSRFGADDAEQAERALEDIEMLKQLSSSNWQDM